MSTLNIGLIGTGFMGRAHSNAYRQVNQFFPHTLRPVLKAVCARNERTLSTFADQWGWESTETDWRKLVERSDIDVVDISTPNNTHCEIALAALAAGKIVLCEKPLAMNLAEAGKMVAAADASSRPTMVFFNYRRIPAVTLAKQLIDEGRLGRVFHYRAKYLQDWTINPESASGWQHVLALGCPSRRQWCDRRSARSLDRPCAMVGRPDRAGDCDD